MAEKARIEYLGFQVGLRIEFSKRMWLGVDFTQSYFLRFRPSEQTADFGSNGIFTFDSPDNSIFSYDRQSPKDVFGIGLRFGLRYPLMDVLHIKPFIAVNVATTGVIHWGIRQQVVSARSYGNQPQPCAFKIGVFETLLSPKPRKRN